MYTERQKSAPVVVKVVPHEEQRYPTVGDYWWEETTQTWQMRISRMPDWRWEKLVEIHERTELWLCLDHGVSMEEIDEFDFKFEEEIKQGRRNPNDEPGDSLNAPYYREHQVATRVERELARAFGVDWKEYDDHVRSM